MKNNIDAILQKLIHEVPQGDLNLLDSTLRIETLKEALTNELISLSREAESSDPLLKGLREKYPANNFWSEMKQRVDSMLRPYRETAFLRDMEATELEHYLLETFESMIHYQEPWSYLSEHLGVDETQLQVTYRVLNTLVQWVIEGRYSKRFFQQECKNFFLWPESLSEVLWKLLDENRTMLMGRALLKISCEIEKTLDKTSNFLDSFDDEDDLDFDDEIDDLDS